MSRKFTVLVAIGSVIAVAACTAAPREEAVPATETAPASPAFADDEQVEATISQLERDWVTAIINKDATALDRLLAEEFAGVSPTAHYYHKDMAINDLTGGTYVVESMNLDEVSVNAYGDMAVAFTSQEEKSRYAGTDLSGHYHYTNVWVYRDGRWQAVASHGTRFEKGH
jgi:ketosteroid isomerase-like protein